MIPASSLPWIVVCRGPHCRERGAIPLRSRLARLVQRRTDVGLIGYACFGQCEVGPNVAFFPQGTWYGGLREEDAAEQVVAHATGEQALARPPLVLAREEREAHLRNIAELVAIARPPPRAAPARRWWWPF